MSLLLHACLLNYVVRDAGAAEPAAVDFVPLDREYAEQITPLLKRYCTDCHATADPAGELDLERFVDLKSVRSDPNVWQHVAEMLDNGEMPPKDADQPTGDERKQLRDWVGRYLHAEAYANAGDPGPVLIRRLNNAEYTYTIQDLTGGPLEPAHEFPADGAAGEGFTNAAAAMVMSPAMLTKYLDAAKEISQHAVFTPDGLHFSAFTTRRDWINELLDQIRVIYRRHSDAVGASQVNLQGIIFDTNDGGRLPLEQYLAATIDERDALRSGTTTIDAVASARKLNAKYLGQIWTALNDTSPAPVLDAIRLHWREAKADEVPRLVAEIQAWQQALWRFTSVGHIGKVGGPNTWQEPVRPLVARQEFQTPVPVAAGATEVRMYLVAGDAGDGNEGDVVLWERPRFVAPGRPDLPLRDVRRLSGALAALRTEVIESAARCLAAAAEASASDAPTDLDALSQRHGARPEILAAWLDYLGLGNGGAAKIDSHLTNQLRGVGGHDFVNGWGLPETPSVIANASDQHVRVPGNLRARGVALHPSPVLQIAAGWRSPVVAQLHIEGFVQHAHPECGNGVAWALEVRRGGSRRTLASRAMHGGAEIAIGPFEHISVRPGDVVALFVGPRDGNHSCDLTEVDLTLRDDERTWSLSHDVASDLLAGNPHADSYGNPDIWHFFTEPVTASAAPLIPADSILARWQSSDDAATKALLASELQTLLNEPAAPPADHPDAVLRRQLTALGGPLLGTLRAKLGEAALAAIETSAASEWGIDPVQFGHGPTGNAIDAESLCVKAPSVLELILRADLVDGYALVATGALAPGSDEGSVQLAVTDQRIENATGLQPAAATTSDAGGAWTSDNERIAFASPIIVRDGSAARARFEQGMDQFRALFPAALCYTKIVPVDEVVTLTQFYREDVALQRLMLSNAEIAELNRLWDALHFVSQDAFTQVDALEQLIQFATQDADPSVFEPLRQPFAERAEAFRQSLVAAEPTQLESLLQFASQAYRRPLEDGESEELRALYGRLRAESLPHDEALRLTLARLLVSPAFLYRLESSAAAASDAPWRPVSDWELATRLSYFLGSTAPDATLRELATAGKLHEPEVLAEQTRRMLRDPKIERMAEEFGCQWLQIYEFDTLDEKSERHFPEFTSLRADMYAEAIHFITDAWQRDVSLVELFDADYTFVNEPLAKFYGLEPDASNTSGSWRRVDGLRDHGRGGVLGFAATLAKNSGASRTSPILRGNWVSEVLLGEKLPKPPLGVPVLPEDESATEGLTVRQLVERHVSDPSCAKCHQRIDPLGFALEGFDAIGRQRDKDLADRPIDTRTTLANGEAMEGLSGLRDYLLQQRRDAVLRQFCRKLLGYALGRSIQLSDQPLIDEMLKQLGEREYRISAAIETIVLSEQFRSTRVGTAAD
ncbi:MAG: DUF1592 domain-containing protein [Planctomycetia bacterium]|nr:DUF1592 domain-containing protein [Planctomycetia bacterium]